MGMALKGVNGVPVVIFQSLWQSDRFILEVSPFEAEMIIRDFLGEQPSSAVSWLEEYLRENPPRFGRMQNPSPAGGEVCFFFSGNVSEKERSLPLSEALSLARRLRIPLFADERFFENAPRDNSFLSTFRIIPGDFLYVPSMDYSTAASRD